MVQQKKNPCKGGIYRITLLTDGRTYIGRTRRKFQTRWYDHRKELDSQTHNNGYLQRAWNKYGAESFEFAILEPVQFIEDLAEAESRWIRFYDATSSDRGFNLLGNINESILPSEENRRNLSAASKKKWQDPEYRAKVRARMDEAICRPEYKAGCAKRSKNMWADEAMREKILKAKEYLSSDADYKLKISQTSKERWDDPEYKAKVSASMKTYYSRPEAKEMMRQIVKEAWNKPGYREQQAKTFSRVQISIRAFDYEVEMPDGTTAIVVDVKAFCNDRGVNPRTFTGRARDGKPMRNGWKIRKIPRIPQG